MVEGYEGRPGAGKTATMVARAWKAKCKGKPVFANIPLIDRREPVRRIFDLGAHRHSETFGKPWSDGMVTNLDEVLALDNALVLLDEIHMWLNSREWADIPFEVLRYLAQQRKIGIDIWWTAQSNARVFNVIRELTVTLWSCQRYGPLSVMVGSDPVSKENMGKRYVWLGPHVWNLYDTEFMVGDRSGTHVGAYGRNEKYHRAEVKAVGVKYTRSIEHVWGLADRHGCYVSYARHQAEPAGAAGGGFPGFAGGVPPAAPGGPVQERLDWSPLSREESIERAVRLLLAGNVEPEDPIGAILAGSNGAGANGKSPRTRNRGVS